MAHWNYPTEPEDGDPPKIDEATKARKWLREEVAKRVTADPLFGALAEIELVASPFYLGLDYDQDCDDVDEMGPF